jgi:hypothetical protein
MAKKSKKLVAKKWKKSKPPKPPEVPSYPAELFAFTDGEEDGLYSDATPHKLLRFFNKDDMIIAKYELVGLVRASNQTITHTLGKPA